MAEILASLKFDSEGFMVDPNAWTPEIGKAIAAREKLVLTDRHWVVINYCRVEFKVRGEPPTLRAIINNTDLTTREIYALFPGGPAKISARIAGLGKPTGCI
jgi:dissimilatory sulfite reductase related protein